MKCVEEPLNMIAMKILGIKSFLTVFLTLSCFIFSSLFTIGAEVTIAVCGEVVRPQVITVSRSISIDEALKICEGFTESASRRLFLIYRVDSDGKKLVIRKDMRDIFFENNKNYTLNDGDMIMVYDKIYWNESKLIDKRIEEILKR